MAARTTIDEESAPLGIVLGGGDIADELIELLSFQRRPLHIASINKKRGGGISSAFVQDFNLAEIGKILKFFKKAGIRDLLLFGTIAGRPSVKSVLTDPGTIKRAPRIISALKSGDDGLLTAIIDMLGDEGFSVLGLDDVAPQFLMPAGKISKASPSRQVLRQLDNASAALDALAPFDVGQGLVYVGERIVAVEAAEGTDAMLERVARLRETGRVSKDQPGFLIKQLKLSQDRRVDLPTIGPNTINLAKEAGLLGIFAEANGVITARRQEMVEMANIAKLFVYGIDRTGKSHRPDSNG